MMPSPLDDDLLLAKAALERLGSPGYYDLLAGLCRARRTSAAQVARNANTTVLAVERAKADLLRELRVLKETAVDVDAFQADLVKVRLAAMQHHLLESLMRDLAEGHLEPKEKADLMKFITKELASPKEAAAVKESSKLSEQEMKERIERLSSK
jgi:hypothetical protein